MQLFSSRNSSASDSSIDPQISNSGPSFHLFKFDLILTPAITILRFVLHLVWCFSQRGKDALGTCTIITYLGVVMNITDCSIQAIPFKFV